MPITLDDGTEVNPDDLVEYIQQILRTQYIIIGKQTDGYSQHNKEYSLDYWLRERAINRNTMQATDNVVNQLVETGLFVMDETTDPHTGRLCDVLMLRI